MIHILIDSKKPLVCIYDKDRDVIIHSVLEAHAKIVRITGQNLDKLKLILYGLYEVDTEDSIG